MTMSSKDGASATVMPTESTMTDPDIDIDAVDHFIDLNNPVDRMISRVLDAASDAGTLVWRPRLSARSSSPSARSSTPTAESGTGCRCQIGRLAKLEHGVASSGNPEGVAATEAASI